MRTWLPLLYLAALSWSELADAQFIGALEPQVRKYMSVGTPKVILEHVQIIDGTGAAPIPDQNISIADGKITAVSAGADQSPSDGTTITDLKLKRAIERGIRPGPHLDVTGPYLDGPNNPNLQMQELTGPEDARQTVAYWADRGVTSFKAYAHLTRAELSAAVKEAHKRGPPANQLRRVRSISAARISSTRFRLGRTRTSW